MRSAPLKPQTMPERIPFLKGRPERDQPIEKDDIFNLRIALGLQKDALDLVRDPHIFDFQP